MKKLDLSHNFRVYDIALRDYNYYLALLCIRLILVLSEDNEFKKYLICIEDESLINISFWPSLNKHFDVWVLYGLLRIHLPIEKPRKIQVSLWWDNERIWPPNRE